ncbi:MAG TPA: deoxyribose-phosphate aldolase [Acholeplasma sp.]|jgi:deoxyribose-phosphate aldolase|nr:deoxyribose-phosphate aldolase [Acholeplasma sp.]
MKLNKYIDHTKLGANVTKAQIDQLISEAKTYDFKSVCVNPIFVKYAKEALKDTDVLVCTVIGFPHGTHTTAVKIFETQDALNNGADEIDMVINIFDLKNDPLKVYEEIKALKDVCGQKVLKVIIETCYLTPEEIVKASELVVKAGADFVKTSTGFGTGGATIENVKLMKETVSNKAEVKASGGVRTYEQAMAMIDAGATRIGTSNGIDIILQRRKDNDSNTSY